MNRIRSSGNFLQDISKSVFEGSFVRRAVRVLFDDLLLLLGFGFRLGLTLLGWRLQFISDLGLGSDVLGQFTDVSFTLRDDLVLLLHSHEFEQSLGHLL